jgi:hypothetical protein
MASKEDAMRRLLLNLMPVNLLHEFGTGRALDNVRREQEEVARTMAIVDALAGRLAPAEREAEPMRPVERIAA